ncbi:MAG: ABC transporter permease subunit [bacterium]|nr:ABC transporter permease subunit [bacterium]
MAVYEREWRRYEGHTTPSRMRFLVITRFALKDAFASRFFTMFYFASLLPFLVGLFLVYLSHNLTLIESMGLTEDFMGGLTTAFFQYLFLWQAVPAFFIAVIVSPNLIAPDLSNSALSLFLSRPIGRTDYVLGKILVLIALLSPVTWFASLIVLSLQAYLEGGMWWWDNIRIFLAHLVGHGTWILVIALLSLAISAWVRFKPAARGVLLGGFFIFQAVSEIFKGISRTAWGDLVDPLESIYIVVIDLFHGSIPADTMPVWAAWFGLAGFSAFSLLLLSRKLKAHEVVR